MTRCGVSTVANPKDLNAKMFQHALELSRNAISRKGTIQEGTLIVDGSIRFWGTGPQSTSEKYADFTPIDCFAAHDNYVNDYALESPHCHFNMSFEVEEDSQQC